MDLILSNNSFIVFDLDDTLYNEFDFLKSGLKAVSDKILTYVGHATYLELFDRFTKKQEVFNFIIEKYKIKNISTEELIELYRNHYPNITLNSDVFTFLKKLSHKIKLGLITDGRSITQRNKLKALGILDKFELLIISEEFGSSKPNEKNFKIFEEKFPESEFIYFGDNIKKDFIAPNNLGWKTFCLLDKGFNIHSQNIEISQEFKPQYYLKTFNELNLIYE